MAKAGKRYPLLIYEHTLSRWWPATLALSIVLFILWWFMPLYKAEKEWQDLALLLISAAAFVMTIFIFLMRKAAYVRPYQDHLRLVTPFLRLKISYKRFHKTTVTKMIELFPATGMSSWRFEAMVPLMSKTAIVVDFKSPPMSQKVLRFFLSPFFFKDKSPHLVLLVDNWMRLSSEMESLRTGGDLGTGKRKDDTSSIFKSFSYKE